MIPGFRSINSDFPNYYTASRMFVEGKDLSNIYDNRQFQKQADFYGIDDIIVSYVPHTPASMLLYAPISSLNPLSAKLVWLILNIIFLIGSIFLLKRIFDISFVKCSIVVFGLVIPLANNFLYGQPYIFITFLICACILLWKRKKHFVSGLILGIISSIKPLPAVLLIPAILNRRWAIICGFILGFIFVQIPIFMLSPEIYTPYMNLVFPASIEGNIQNPYDVQLCSISVFLRNMFLADPFRNPSPVFNSPILYFYLKAFISLFFIGLYLTIVGKLRTHESQSGTNEAFYASIFLILAFLITPFSSTYQYVLLVVPLVYLMKKYDVLHFLLLFEIIFFFILKRFQIPYAELIFVLLITIFVLAKENPSILRLRLSHVIAYLLILVLPFFYSYQKINQISKHSFRDYAEPVTDIDIRGFPGELRSFGSNIYFTEISDGNYHLNLNGKDIGFKGYDIFNPCILPMDGYLLLACQMIDKGRSQIVLFVEKDGKWFIVWKKSVEDVGNIEIVRWLGNPFDGIALIWTEPAFSVLNISWPFSLRTELNLTLPWPVKMRWVDSTGELFILRVFKDSSSTIWPLEILTCQNPSPEELLDTCRSQFIPVYLRSIFDFDVSPNGKYIAYSGEDYGENPDVEIIEIKHKYLSHLTNFLDKDFAPAFVAFEDDSGNLKEYVYLLSERGGGINDARLYRIDLKKISFYLPLIKMPDFQR